MAKDDERRGKDTEIERILKIARALKLPVGQIERAGSEANLFGVRSSNLLISRRLDSRTWFVQDRPDASRKPADVFKGPDRLLRERGRKILKILGIPQDEMGEELVLQERTRTAKMERAGKVSMGRVQRGAKLLRIQRDVRGAPIWSSSVLLRLGNDERIVFLQAHWPELPDRVIDEACELGHQIENGWCPPPQTGASPESIEAGVIHSPAVGFMMDTYAAVRVIYEPWNQLYGRKLTLHLDRHGRPVPQPRIGELPEEPPQERKELRESQH